MITKESLKNNQKKINEALLLIKQKYTNSSSSHNIFLVVEGNDDVPYYGTKANEYIKSGWAVITIVAYNRKNVVQTYRKLDWTLYKKERILFFVDRDLSDYTGEDTPMDDNVYITSKYSIENELCTFNTFLNALKMHCNLLKMNEEDESTLLAFYNKCWNSFLELLDPIMAYILYWKLNRIEGNYSNFKIQNCFTINNDGLIIDSKYITDDSLLIDFHKQSNVEFKSINIKEYLDKLKLKHTADEYIRGKYILPFFVKIINYINKYSASVLPSGIKAKDRLNIGQENIITRLCGVMKTPDSLVDFLKRDFSKLR